MSGTYETYKNLLRKYKKSLEEIPLFDTVGVLLDPDLFKPITKLILFGKPPKYNNKNSAYEEYVDYRKRFLNETPLHIAHLVNSSYAKIYPDKITAMNIWIYDMKKIDPHLTVSLKSQYGCLIDTVCYTTDKKNYENLPPADDTITYDPVKKIWHDDTTDIAHYMISGYTSSHILNNINLCTKGENLDAMFLFNLTTSEIYGIIPIIVHSLDKNGYVLIDIEDVDHGALLWLGSIFSKIYVIKLDKIYMWFCGFKGKFPRAKVYSQVKKTDPVNLQETYSKYIEDETESNNPNIPIFDSYNILTQLILDFSSKQISLEELTEILEPSDTNPYKEINTILC
jgi:hypothetical protein